jgi:Flp pilus assembly protein CpaB
MKNSGLIWWIGAFVLAVLAGILTYGLLTSSLPAAAAGSTDINTITVIVAATDIPFRRSISEEDLTTRKLPVDSVPVGVAIALDQVVGKMSTVDLFANEPILTQQLVTPDVVTQQVALSVPDGKIVFAVPTQSKLISNRLLRPGDFIDLMATFYVQVEDGEDKVSEPKTISMLQGLEIHAIILPGATVEEGPGSIIDQEGGIFRTVDEAGQSVLLAIDAQNALAIMHVLNVGGTLDLSLRPKSDEIIVETEVVDELYLADRYNIDLTRD